MRGKSGASVERRFKATNFAIKLLEHFAEEHEWLAEDLGPADRASGSPAMRQTAPTVGSLLGMP